MSFEGLWKRGGWVVLHSATFGGFWHFLPTRCLKLERAVTFPTSCLFLKFITLQTTYLMITGQYLEREVDFCLWKTYSIDWRLLARYQKVLLLLWHGRVCWGSNTPFQRLMSRGELRSTTSKWTELCPPSPWRWGGVKSGMLLRDSRKCWRWL